MQFYKQFEDKLNDVIPEEDMLLLRNMTYWQKRNYLDSILPTVLKEESVEFKADVLGEKDDYLKEACCHYANMYNELTWDQKLIILINLYKLYTIDEEGTRVYLDKKDFLVNLDNGTIENYGVSVMGYISDFLLDLGSKEVNVSDAIFWLQHEWYNLSGDFFEKNKKDYLTRRTQIFTAKHYIAFNEVFKHCFGRNIKCYDKYKPDCKKGLIDQFKSILDGDK